MNGLQQRAHRSVTERLSDRLDVIEPLVERMMRNGDALYQGHEANAARIAKVEADVAKLIADAAAMAAQMRSDSKLHRDDWHAHDTRLDEMHECCQERWDATSEATKRLGDRHQAFVGRTFWAKLRWMVSGG